MERNFFRRVEVAFPIQRPSHRQRILDDLTRYLDDNSQAWTLLSDGRYERLSPADERPRSAQSELLGTYAAGMSITAPPDALSPAAEDAEP
jgi:polyphosphate kinase